MDATTAVKDFKELEAAIVKAETYAKECKDMAKKAKAAVDAAIGELRAAVRDAQVGQLSLALLQSEEERAAEEERSDMRVPAERETD